ncbi:MAG: hypothetical protein FD144_5907, partial [Rhodospirillaceae bacterium]
RSASASSGRTDNIRDASLHAAADPAYTSISTGLNTPSARAQAQRRRSKTTCRSPRQTRSTDTPEGPTPKVTISGALSGTPSARISTESRTSSVSSGTGRAPREAAVKAAQKQTASRAADEGARRVVLDEIDYAEWKSTAASMGLTFEEYASSRPTTIAKLERLRKLAEADAERRAARARREDEKKASAIGSKAAQLPLLKPHERPQAAPTRARPRSSATASDVSRDLSLSESDEDEDRSKGGKGKESGSESESGSERDESGSEEEEGEDEATEMKKEAKTKGRPLTMRECALVKRRIRDRKRRAAERTARSGGQPRTPALKRQASRGSVRSTGRTPGRRRGLRGHEGEEEEAELAAALAKSATDPAAKLELGGGLEEHPRPDTAATEEDVRPNLPGFEEVGDDADRAAAALTADDLHGFVPAHLELDWIADGKVPGSLIEDMDRVGVAVPRRFAVSSEGEVTEEEKSEAPERPLSPLEGQPEGFDSAAIRAALQNRELLQFAGIAKMMDETTTRVVAFMKQWRTLFSPQARKEINDMVVVRVRIGNIDRRALRAYGALKRDLNPNEIHSARLIAMNAPQLGTNAVFIRDRLNHLREKGPFWNPLYFFQQLGRLVPELAQPVSRITRVVGHQTLTIEVRGVLEARAVLEGFLAHHRAATRRPKSTKGLTHKKVHKKGDTADAVVYEFGLTPTSQERLRYAFSKQVSRTLDHPFIYMLVMTGQLHDDTLRDAAADAEEALVAGDGVDEALASGVVYADYVRLDVPEPIRARLLRDELHGGWRGSACNACYVKGEMLPLALFLASFTTPSSTVAGQRLLDFVADVQRRNPKKTQGADFNRRLTIEEPQALHEERPASGPDQELHLGFCSFAPYGVAQVTSRYLQPDHVDPPSEQEAIVIATTNYAYPRPLPVHGLMAGNFTLRASHVTVMDGRGRLLLSYVIEEPDGRNVRRSEANTRLEAAAGGAVSLETAAERTAALIGHSRYAVGWNLGASLAALGLAVPWVHCVSLDRDPTFRRQLAFQLLRPRVATQMESEFLQVNCVAPLPIGFAVDLLTQGRVTLRPRGMRLDVRDCAFTVACWQGVGGRIAAEAQERRWRRA